MRYFIAKKGDKYIGEDLASGGYTYETEFLSSAKIIRETQLAGWQREAAKNDWTLYEIQLVEVK